jgi:transcriptional regulator with XRE-family HTH domain
MTPEQFKDLQAAAGWTNAKIADRLRVSEPTVERWRTGKTRIPGPVELLLPQLVRTETRARKA